MANVLEEDLFSYKITHFQVSEMALDRLLEQYGFRKLRLYRYEWDFAINWKEYRTWNEAVTLDIPTWIIEDLLTYWDINYLVDYLRKLDKEYNIVKIRELISKLTWERRKADEETQDMLKRMWY